MNSVYAKAEIKKVEICGKKRPLRFAMEFRAEWAHMSLGTLKMQIDVAWFWDLTSTKTYQWHMSCHDYCEL